MKDIPQNHALRQQPPANDDAVEIYLAREQDILSWTRELGVTVYELRDAIVATGSRAANDIRDYFDRAA